jgi:hypothetical protein
MKKNITARYKIMSPNEIERISEKNSRTFGLKKTEFLDHMIRGSIGDILCSKEKIIREKQRINKAKNSIKNVLIVLGKGKGDEVKRTYQKFYSDLLQYNISEVSSYKNG